MERWVTLRYSFSNKWVLGVLSMALRAADALEDPKSDEFTALNGTAPEVLS